MMWKCGGNAEQNLWNKYRNDVFPYPGIRRYPDVEIGQLTKSEEEDA